MTGTALVTGATGYVGSRLVSALARRGRTVVATGRSMRGLSAHDWPDEVTRAELDVSDPDSCRQALTRHSPVETLYYLVHVVGEDDFAAKDLASARTTAEAAAEAGVGRIVYLGGLAPGGEDLSEHLQSRAAVGEELAAHDVDAVLLRAAVVLGAGSASYEVVRQLARRLPVVPMPAWMDAPLEPIAVSDVVDYLVLAGGPEVPPGAYDVAGPETLSYSDLIRRVAASEGRRRLYLRVPGVSPALASPVVARLTAVPTGMVDDLVHSLVNDMRADDTAIASLRGPDAAPLVGVDEALRRARSGPRPLRGGHATSDPLALTATDARWARTGLDDL